jgi:hypothetical protein
LRARAPLLGLALPASVCAQFIRDACKLPLQLGHCRSHSLRERVVALLALERFAFGQAAPLLLSERLSRGAREVLARIAHSLVGAFERDDRGPQPGERDAKGHQGDAHLLERGGLPRQAELRGALLHGVLRLVGRRLRLRELLGDLCQALGQTHLLGIEGGKPAVGVAQRLLAGHRLQLALQLSAALANAFAGSSQLRQVLPRFGEQPLQLGESGPACRLAGAATDERRL